MHDDDDTIEVVLSRVVLNRAGIGCTNPQKPDRELAERDVDWLN